jgi:hypothetical protein
MPILLVKPGRIRTAKRDELKQAGYIVIEMVDFSDVKIVDELASLEPNILLESALSALDYGNDPTCRNAFGKLIRDKIISKLKTT